MTKDAVTSHQEASGLKRMGANIAWLFGGKGFGAICSIAYLAILARSLGIRDFGHFSLIFATGQAFVALAGFQSWQTMVRYGTRYVHAQDWVKFGRLSMLCGLLDWIGATLGCVVAWIGYYIFADDLGLNPAYIDMAFAFNCVLLWSRVSAPVGIVRVLDRFDIAVYVEGLVPLGRLLAALLLWFTGPTVGKFLFAWAAIDLLSAAAYWISARWIAPTSLRARHIGDWRTTLTENEGIARFFGVTYASSTLDIAFKQGPVLAVGYFLGTSAAGIYRLADQLAQGFGKLSQLVGRAIYSDINRSRVAQTAAQFRQLVKRVTAIAGIGSILIVTLALLLARQLLGFIGGEGYESGAVIFVPLALAASLEMASVAYEPVLHATNHARLALLARILAIAALGCGMLLLVSQGSLGIAWAVVAGQAFGYLAMGTMVLIAMRKMGHSQV
ncbi:lipopolysaccharide biosynthesis protein [uncultured Parasphingorhabdus sp.]|uniref:lipopolysaccharide biosynthesis protein n=1 Tax=uncultured Parasphingorhabdus sp. TaxID=2709694 RepID=UPI0030DB7AB6|tara:strand:- start:22424 stop:23752 length:1329 start_codon:yes stop_codon:yes gene_type:complete